MIELQIFGFTGSGTVGTHLISCFWDCGRAQSVLGQEEDFVTIAFLPSLWGWTKGHCWWNNAVMLASPFHCLPGIPSPYANSHTNQSQTSRPLEPLVTQSFQSEAFPSLPWPPSLALLQSVPCPGPGTIDCKLCESRDCGLAQILPCACHSTN